MLLPTKTETIDFTVANTLLEKNYETVHKPEPQNHDENCYFI